MNPEDAKKLREPFPADAVSVLPKPYTRDSARGNCRECGGYHGLPAVHLDCVGHADVTDRLLSVDPEWSWEPLSLDEHGLPAFDHLGGLWIRLTVCGVTRLGYGDAQGKTGPNAIKECIGDAIRNASMRFGVALDLWRKEWKAEADASKQGHDTDTEPESTVESDAQWMTEFEKKIDLADSNTAVATLRGELNVAVKAKRLHPTDANRLLGRLDERRKELTAA